MSAHTSVPRGLSVIGDVIAEEDITIHGRVDGRVTLPAHRLTIADSASITGKIVARSVDLAGTVDANILAGERIHLRAGASLRGHVKTAAIVLDDGASFTGTVDPDRDEAAMRVARYRERQGG